MILSLFILFSSLCNLLFYLSDNLPDDDTIIGALLTNGAKKKNDGVNGYGYSSDRLKELTKYTLCIIAYDAQGRRGELVKREFTTKSSANQPVVNIKINNILDDRVFYDFTKNSYTSFYVNYFIYGISEESMMNRPDVWWGSFCYEYYKESASSIKTIDEVNASRTITANRNYYAIVTMGFDGNGVNSGVISKVFYSTETKSVISQ